MSFFIELLKSIVFGIVQGITEWLPISSTGHLILLNNIMPLTVYEDPAMNAAFWGMYKVVIQFGSIIAVLLLYWRRLNPFYSPKASKGRKKSFDLWIKIIIATIPAGIAGVFLDDLIDAKLSKPSVVAITLIAYGILFIWVESRHLPEKYRTIDDVDYKTAGKIGCFQALALIPGTSRSGSTILGSLLVGTSRPAATEFSFFMAIPVMLGASVLKLLKMKITIGWQGLVILLVGMMVAFIVSVIVIRSFLKFIRSHDFKFFGVYRIVLGVLILALIFADIIPNGIL